MEINKKTGYRIQGTSTKNWPSPFQRKTRIIKVDTLRRMAKAIDKIKEDWRWVK